MAYSNDTSQTHLFLTALNSFQKAVRNNDVKRLCARTVHGWETTWEHLVLLQLDCSTLVLLSAT